MDAPDRTSISPAGDIPELISAVRERPLNEILSLLKEEKRSAEAAAKHAAKVARSDPSPPTITLRDQMFTYAASIRRLIYWLNSAGKKKPGGCDEFPQFRPLAESLASRGLIDPRAMSLFGETSTKL